MLYIKAMKQDGTYQILEADGYVEFLKKDVVDETSTKQAVEIDADAYTYHADDLTLVKNEVLETQAYNPLKTNKFKVGDEVEIVKLDKTMQRFGGASLLKPVGTKAFVTRVGVTEGKVEIVYNYYDNDEILRNGRHWLEGDCFIMNDKGFTISAYHYKP